MSGPEIPRRFPIIPKEVSTTEANAEITRALVNLLLTIPSLPPQVIDPLQRLRANIHPFALAAEAHRAASDLSAICETAIRNLGR